MDKQMWMSFGKFLAGCAISTLTAFGGMWFVLDRSLQGIISSVDSTNQGMNRLNDTVLALGQRMDARFASMELRIDNLIMKVGEGFDKTQQKIEKKAELESNGMERQLADLTSVQKQLTETIAKVESGVLSATWIDQPSSSLFMPGVSRWAAAEDQSLSDGFKISRGFIYGDPGPSGFTMNDTGIGPGSGFFLSPAHKPDHGLAAQMYSRFYIPELQ